MIYLLLSLVKVLPKNILKTSSPCLTSIQLQTLAHGCVRDSEPLELQKAIQT
jgi:hypothetical protein